MLNKRNNHYFSAMLRSHEKNNSESNRILVTMLEIGFYRKQGLKPRTENLFRFHSVFHTVVFTI